MTSVRRARDQVEAGFSAGRGPDRRNRRCSHPAAGKGPAHAAGEETLLARSPHHWLRPAEGLAFHSQNRDPHGARALCARRAHSQLGAAHWAVFAREGFARTARPGSRAPPTHAGSQAQDPLPVPAYPLQTPASFPRPRGLEIIWCSKRPELEGRQNPTKGCHSAFNASLSAVDKPRGAAEEQRPATYRFLRTKGDGNFPKFEANVADNVLPRRASAWSLLSS